MSTIFHLDDARSWRGGEQQVLYLHEALLAGNWDSRVICAAGGELESRLQGLRLPHYALRIGGGHDLAAAWKIGGLLRAEAGLLHTHTSHAHDLALWASRLRGRFSMVVSRRVDFPVAQNFLSRRKYLNGRVDRYLAISSGVERALLQGGVPAAKIARASSGIRMDRFEEVHPRSDLRTELGVPDGAILFGNVAALAPHKDQATLLRAFELYLRDNGAGHLVIFGEGELRAELEKLRASLGIEERVHMPGFFTDILPRIRALDVFVLSSSLEGLGTSILDAMALERCVIATDTGGIPDAVQHERNGLLVPPNNAEALAAAMTRIETDGPLRRELGRNAVESVQRFDIQNTVEATERVYREVLGMGV